MVRTYSGDVDLLAEGVIEGRFDFDEISPDCQKEVIEYLRCYFQRREATSNRERIQRERTEAHNRQPAYVRDANAWR